MISSLKAEEASKFSLKDLTAKHPRKALIYGIFLMAMNQFTGVFAMMNFTAMIFNESGSNLSPNVSSIIVGALQTLGAISCTFLVEKAGRKVLFMISAFGISLGLAIMSLYTYSKTLGVDLSSWSWVPLVSFSFVNFIFNWGVNTLPFLYVSEVVPKKTKVFTMTLSLAMLFIFATIVIQVQLTSLRYISTQVFFYRFLQFLSTLISLLGLHGTMLLFSINSLVGAIFIACFLPETKGKSYAEILKLME